MPARWPEEVNDAIWALLCEGKYPAEITRLLNNGDAGLEQSYAIKVPTVRDKAMRLKQTRGEPKTFIAPGREADAASALRRKALDMARREIDALDEKESLTVNEVKHLINLAKLVDDIEARLKARAQEKDPDRQAGGRAAQQKPSRGLLADIQKREEARRRELAASAAANGDTKPESQEPDRPAQDSTQQRAKEKWSPYETSGPGFPD